MNDINSKIKNLRTKLNELIENKSDYSDIYKISTELDELILEYTNTCKLNLKAQLAK